MSRFIQFCQATDYQYIAQVVKSSLACCCVLFEFISAIKNNIKQDLFVGQAFDFIKHTNKLSCDELANASDAAFTIADFHLLVERRLNNFKNIDISKPRIIKLMF